VSRRMRRTGTKASQRSRLNVTLDAGTLRRLRAFAGWKGSSVSAIVAEAVRVAMRGFSVSQEGQGSSGTDGPPSEAGDVQGVS
jgi:hypothetical protein